MTKIAGLQRLDETIQRCGHGDNWHMTWANNDKQYVALCDGSGWEGVPEYTGDKYNTRVYAINGDAPNHTFEHLPGYPDLMGPSRYYGFGILALDGHIYQFLSTPKFPFGPPDNGFIGAKLIYSPDNGQNWRNQDGSPLRWESWDERSRDNMVFYFEPGDAFSLLTILQMGKNYGDNTDGYVYIYAPNGNEEGNMNQLVMFRVPKHKVLDRSAYEYFVSRRADGTADWSSDINDRGVVHTFPSGWVNWKIGRPWGGHPYAWHPSVVYNAPLGQYVMVNWGMGVGSDGGWFGKPSYLGFWTAPKPWGPWAQVHEEEAWMPESNPAARAYQPQISPKWIAKDGKSFWLVWTDYREMGSEPRKYYSFNCQKVNILTTPA